MSGRVEWVGRVTRYYEWPCRVGRQGLLGIMSGRVEWVGRVTRYYEWPCRVGRQGY